MKTTGKNSNKAISLLVSLIFLGISSCSNDDASSDTTSNDGGDQNVSLHAAFSEFDTNNVSISLNGSNVVIESNGRTNHVSPYWSPNHPLYVDPTVTTQQQMAPGFIDDFNGSFLLTVPANPQLAGSSSATGLGPIGIAISGAVIYNDQEGPNVPLDGAIVSLDYTGAHTGPQSYHYHLEPRAWSIDDSELIGIISDGFFVYGRKCVSTGGYPTDLDASGGHTSATQHSNEVEYHYHIQNEPYLNQYYIIFPGDYQGTPNTIQ